jgi:hypothetical protein
LLNKASSIPAQASLEAQQHWKQMQQAIISFSWGMYKAPLVWFDCNEV